MDRVNTLLAVRFIRRPTVDIVTSAGVPRLDLSRRNTVHTTRHYRESGEEFSRN